MPKSTAKQIAYHFSQPEDRFSAQQLSRASLERQASLSRRMPNTRALNAMSSAAFLLWNSDIPCNPRRDGDAEAYFRCLRDRAARLLIQAGLAILDAEGKDRTSKRLNSSP